MNRIILLIMTLFAFCFATDCVVINEIHYNPDYDQGQADEDFEFIELYNQCNEEIDISHWALYRHDSCWGCYYDKILQFGNNTYINGNEYIVLSHNSNTYDNIFQLYLFLLLILSTTNKFWGLH